MVVQALFICEPTKQAILRKSGQLPHLNQPCYAALSPPKFSPRPTSAALVVQLRLVVLHHRFGNYFRRRLFNMAAAVHVSTLLRYEIVSRQVLGKSSPPFSRYLNLYVPVS